MAHCQKSGCGAIVAMRKVGPGSGVWTTYEPELDVTGQPIEVLGKNGTGPNGEQRYAWRLKASDIKHVCGVTKPVHTNAPHKTREQIQQQTPAPAPAPAPAPGPAPVPRCPHGYIKAPGQDYGEYCPETSCVERRTPAPPRVDTSAPAPQVPQVDMATLKAELRAEVVETIKGFGIKPPPRVLIVRGPDGKDRQQPDGEIYHPSVDRLVALLAQGMHVYLTGPAGSGKTHGACQAARMMGLPFDVVTMPGQTSAKLLGYVKPDGTVVDTPFTRMFEKPGVLVLDEFDRTDPGVAAMLNSCLENGLLNHGGKLLRKDPAFCVVANGNTSLRGASREYTAAKPIDYATAARFVFLRWNYDETHEASLVEQAFGGNLEASSKLLGWIRKIRAAIARDKINLVFAGPREARRIALDMMTGTDFAEAAHGHIWKGLDEDIVSRLVREIPYPTIQTTREDK